MYFLLKLLTLLNENRLKLNKNSTFNNCVSYLSISIILLHMFYFDVFVLTAKGQTFLISIPFYIILNETFVFFLGYFKPTVEMLMSLILLNVIMITEFQICNINHIVSPTTVTSGILVILLHNYVMCVWLIKRSISTTI